MAPTDPVSVMAVLFVPEHTATPPPLIAPDTGNGRSVMVTTLLVSEHPDALVTTTRYTPADVALYKLEEAPLITEPFFNQTYEAPVPACSLAEPPTQMAVVSIAVSEVSTWLTVIVT
jgi:hypothetical protein